MGGGASEIELCWTSLDDYPGSYSDDLSGLGREEIARADRFKVERDRRRYVARHRWLRECLAVRLGCTAVAIEIRQGAGGKPLLADGSIAFSVAHSDGIALLAVGAVETIGCDLEWCDPALNIDEISGQLSIREQSALGALAAPDRLAGLYRAWVCKEAFLKATGEGLTRPLDSFDVRVDPHAPPALLGGCRGWSVETFVPLAGYQAAIVAPGAWRLRLVPRGSPPPAAP